MSFPLAFALNTLTKEEVVDKIRDYIKNNMYLNDEHDGEYSFDTYYLLFELCHRLVASEDFFQPFR